MIRGFVRKFLLGVLFVAATHATNGAGADPFLIPFDGTVGGEFTPFGNPELKGSWKFSATTDPSGSRKLGFSVAAKDAAFAAEAAIKPGSERIEWRILNGKVQLGTWFEAVAKRYFPKASGASVAGFLALSGAGTSSHSLSEYTGGMMLELVGASIADAAGGWSFKQILAKIELIQLPQIKSAPRQRIQFLDGMVGQVELRRGLIEFTIESSSRIQVHVMTLEVLGGAVTIEPFTLDLDQARASARLALNGIDLAKLRPYLPGALADAQGKIDGHLQLNWSGAEGLKFGAGDLRLRKDTPASLRLAPAPGFLSSRVPARFNLLPSWLGPISRAFSSAVPAHSELVAIEMGEEPLVVESVQADLSAAGAGNDSTASIHIVAHPRKTDVVKQLRLNVNVSGPLADVVRFGLDGRLSFGQ